MKKLLSKSVVLILALFAIFLQRVTAEESAEYKVDVGDALEINVLQPEKLGVAVTVSPDGSISFPYVGNVQVKGLGLNEIQNKIEARLSDGYMKYPLVSVILKSPHSRKFFVYGDIAKPGVYPMDDEKTTILKAISMAGGLGKSNVSMEVKVLRPLTDGNGTETIAVNITKVLHGDAQENILILPEDTVMISQGKFYVYGEVSKPGVYTLNDEGTTVLKAISMAGGLGRGNASIDVKVLRPLKYEGGSETILVDIRKAMEGDSDEDIDIMPNDTVMVSQGKFYVYGEVNKPGAFPVDDDITVLKAITLADGFTKFGSPASVKVLRPRDDGSGYENIKVNVKKITEGSFEDDVHLRGGDTVVVSDKLF